MEKPGQEDQVQQFAVAHARCLVRGDQALVQSLLLDALEIDSRAVIGDFDIDLPAFVEGAQEEAPLRGFSSGHALFRRLNAVIDGVADQVGERILDGFDEGLVEFRLLAFHLQADLFPTSRRQDHARRGEICSRCFRWAACGSS